MTFGLRIVYKRSGNFQHLQVMNSPVFSPKTSSASFILHLIT